MATSRMVAVAALAAVVFVAGAAASTDGGDASSLHSVSLKLDDFSDLTYCKTATSTSLVITGGSGTVRASSSCQAKVDAVNAVESQFLDWLALAESEPERACTEEELSKVAKASGLAISTAYTSAAVAVEIDGTGEGCASAQAEADSFSTSFAKAVVKAPVEKGVLDPEFEGLCLAGALSVAFSEAWASAKAQACQQGTGNIADFQVSVADSVQKPIARVSVELAKDACAVSGNEDKVAAYLQSLVDGSAAAIDATASDEALQRASEGIAMASGGSLQRCESEDPVCCSDRGVDNGVCELEALPSLTRGSADVECCCLDGLLAFLP